jgi:hypothetical protein
LLTEAQVTRYARQLLLPEIGGLGQEAILSARVSLRGTGAALEAAALYLSAAGVAAVASEEHASWVVDGVGAGRAGGGLPCGDCLATWFGAQPRPPPSRAPAAALAAGAAASAEILLQIVDPTRAKRPFAVRVTPDAAVVHPSPSRGCPRCAGPRG